MRVLHIIPTLQKGGAERICLDICNELQKRNGIKVLLVVLHNKLDYDYSSGIEPIIISSSLKLSLWRKNSLNIDSLKEAIAKFQPDIIHSHLFEAEIVSRSIIYPQAKWFSHCHDNMWQLDKLKVATLFDKKRLTAYYERQYLLTRYRKNGGNHFIAISKDTEEYFKHVLPEDLRNITLLPNAVNTSKFTKPDGYVQIRKAHIELVTIGSLVDKKNQTFLLDVIHHLRHINFDVHLHVLGDGKNRKKLEEKAMQLNICDSVTFHGNVSDVEAFLWNCDMYLHSALYEPFGLVLIEAMAAGLPVISLDGKGNRDIVISDYNGYMVSNSVEEFASRIIYLKENKEVANRISLNAVKFAQDYDIKIYTDKLLKIYTQALNPHYEYPENSDS